MINYKKAKEIVSKVIDNEFHHVVEGNFKYMNSEIKEEYEALRDREREIYKRIADSLPKEAKSLICDYSDLMGDQALLENMYYFREGVESGVGNLNFLKETGAL